MTDAPPPICIAMSRYNDRVTSAMLAGAEARFADRGGTAGDLAVIECAGAFELVSVAAAAVRTGRYAGVLALGCIIRGETDHDRYLAHAIAHGLADLAITHDASVSFGVLTTNTAEQALERASGAKGNKGADAMDALLDAIAASEVLRSASESRPGVRYEIGRMAEDKTAAGGDS